MLQLAARPSRLESILSDLSAVDSSQPRSVGSLYGRGPTTQCRGWWGRLKGEVSARLSLDRLGGGQNPKSLIYKVRRVLNKERVLYSKEEDYFIQRDITI